ncbi:riboflavin biosynthesis protein RibD [Ammonifex degensii KC4]|uniref:Riboflavin biosynthesis protein RibD n=1 Tax=Ammonifex degensii (strain DSM 10501 / KC4) TaxID=429009 RepID=C9R9T2_AMMDK|nr:bifunctional diaminohydroxyphosphoribosylaminopyrimidine deaminase/5-amino-6-(5-phosphoribosylamino)uracil reductase RibD [Ammonifex degensii]ACX53061.1 riboflavin biosynthesis protein RibD [Ammonifex degensii KC4]
MENLKEDEFFMRRALELALKARGRTSPNPMVGAVLVKEGRVIAEGYHRRAGMPHAEIEALRAAGEEARGATLYVNLEPCCHVGRTGPCTEAIIAAGIKRVVVAMEDPNPLVAGKGIKILREAGLEVTVGVLEQEARRLNEVFVKFITTREPFVVLKVAMTLDGKIATSTGEARWITGPEARAYVHELRDTYDAILVGKGTVLKDDPSLTARLPGARDPVRVILSSLADLPLSARVLNLNSSAPTWVAVTEQAPPSRIKALQGKGAEVLVCGPGPQVDLKLLLKELGRREITGVLVEGGGTVNASFLANRLVDKVIWMVAPKIFGGTKAPGPVGGEGVEHPDRALRLKDLTVKKLGADFCFEGYPEYPEER